MKLAPQILPVCLVPVSAVVGAVKPPPAAAGRIDASSLPPSQGVRPEAKNPKQALVVRQKFPVWNLTGEPLPPKWGKLDRRYAMLYCWPEPEKLLYIKREEPSDAVHTDRLWMPAVGVVLRAPSAEATHVDGVPLLDREGAAVGCGSGWIILRPGEHALRIRGQDHPIRFSTGKHSLTFGVTTETVGERQCLESPCWTLAANRQCVETRCWQPVRVLGSWYRVETLKEVLLKVELTNLDELWKMARFEPLLEEYLVGEGLDARELLEMVLPKLGLVPPGEQPTD